MSVPARVASALATSALVVALTACVGAAPAPEDTPVEEPLGPQPPALITLQQLATVVTADDAPADALFDVGAASDSGSDLLAEQDYWDAVGGSPEECADIVSSPYLVSSVDGDDGNRLDDPTGVLGTFSEDEDRFGLVQVAGRIFDDAATASRFLDEFLDAVAACPGYRLTGEDGATNYAATALDATESADAPLGTRVVTYTEDVDGSGIVSVGTTFVQHENAVIAIYDELYSSSTMTAPDIMAVTAAVTGRLAGL